MAVCVFRLRKKLPPVHRRSPASTLKSPPFAHRNPKALWGGFVSGIATTCRRPAKGVGYIARADGNTRVVQQDLPVLAVVE